MQPDGIETVLIKYLKPMCPICRQNIDYSNIVAVSCCDAIYHKECLHESHNFIKRCPNCEVKFYKENVITPTMQNLKRRVYSIDTVHQLYHNLYIENPVLLRQIDKHLRGSMSSAQYHKQFVGYFPVNIFCKEDHINKFSTAEIFKDRLDEFTYGIFRQFVWLRGTYMVGATMTLALYATPDQPKDPISFLVCHPDYRVVRQMVIHIFSHLKLVLSAVDATVDACIGMQNNTIIIFIPGFSRKVTIELECRDDIFWVMYGKQPYRDFSLCYDGQQVYCTVKSAADTLLAPTHATICNDMLQFNLKYGETAESFTNRTKVACICGYDEFVKHILKLYVLIFRVSSTLDAVQAYMLRTLSTGAASTLIDVLYVTDESATADYIISIDEALNATDAVPNDYLGSTPLKIFNGIVTEQNICDFVLKSHPYHRSTIYTAESSV